MNKVYPDARSALEGVVADGQTSDGLREPDDLLHTHIIAV